MPTSNPATLAQPTQDERIPGLPAVAAGTDRTTLLVPAYNPATDKTEHVPLTDPDGDGGATAAQLAAHEADHANPHQTTAAQVGLNNVPNVDATQRNNHQGTQPAASISDFTTAVRALLGAAGSVVQYDAATGLLSVKPVPVFASDVYSSGPGEFGPQAENGDRLVKRSELVNYYNKFSWKRVVRLATQVNVSLSGTPTVDGVASAAGNRVLVKAQTIAAENGIYTIPSGGGAWVRAAEADSWDELVNATVFVSQGSNDHDKLYTCTVDEGGTLGTTAISWMQIGAGLAYQFGQGFDTNGTTVTLNVAALKTLLAYSTDELTEGTTKLFFTEARVLLTKLTGYVKDTAYAALVAGTTTVQQWMQQLEWRMDQRLRNRGAWAASTAYAVNDMVSYGGVAYYTDTAFTSGTSFNSANWKPFSPVAATFFRASCSGSSTTFQAIPTGVITKVNFPVLVYGSGFDTSTSTYTVPVSGYYQVNALVELSPASTGDIYLMLYKNGTRAMDLSHLGNSLSGVYIGTSATTDLLLAAGDTLFVSCQHYCGTGTSVVQDPFRLVFSARLFAY